MTPTSRRRAFALAAAAVTAAALIALVARPAQTPAPMTTTRTRGPAPAAAAPHRRPPLTPPERPDPRAHPHNAANGRGARSLARAIARDFLAAYLRYEASPTGRRARELARLTLPGSPARAMLKTPPRRVPGATEGRIALLEIHGPYQGRLKASAIVRYGGRRLLLELILARGRAGGYRVQDVSL